MSLSSGSTTHQPHDLPQMKPPSTERNRIDDLATFARLMRDMDPEIINAATRAERHRIAALIELQEGPGRFLP